MTMLRAATPAPQAHPEADIDLLLAVIGRLNLILAEENALLGEGLPAALSELTTRKLALSDELDALSQSVLTHHAEYIAAHPALRNRIIDAGRDMQARSQENLKRLTGAIAATHRRIAAIMAAIRAENAKNAGYGPRGTSVAADAAVSGLSTTLRAVAGGYKI